MGDQFYTSKQRKTFHGMFITVVTVKVGCLTSASHEVTGKCRNKIKFRKINIKGKESFKFEDFNETTEPKQRKHAS